MLTDELKNFRIILASGSPRRQALLRQAGLHFDVILRDFNEDYPAGLSGKEIAEYISAAKAHSVKDELSGNDIIITADTIVWCNGRVLGKPVNNEDALRMLKAISGNVHEVITGVTISSKWDEITFSESTRVTFETLSTEEIKYYTEKYKPFDKAGAYGIQEWIGIIGCSRIEGSYFNVVGLPVQKLYYELKKFTRSK
ncbi:MAG TPA: Maf family nucleotide pyrophosphatase [Bacteroidales bacterium]|nr:Maf family nucleotide pyrophosphatase [Bacteroidales bacterium]